MRARVDMILRSEGLKYQVLVLGVHGDTLAAGGEFPDIREALDSAISSVHADAPEGPLSIRFMHAMRGVLVKESPQVTS